MQPDSCKSRDTSVVCSNCIDSLADKLVSELAPGTDLCAVTSAELTRCISPEVSTLSSAGANLGALVGCNQAAVSARLKAKYGCR